MIVTPAATGPLSLRSVAATAPLHRLERFETEPEAIGHAAAPDRLPEYAVQLLQPFFPKLNLRRVIVDASSDLSQWIVNQAGAAAVTLGNRVFVHKDEYNPGTVDGLALIGHELTHVQQYQQRGTGGFFWRYGTDYLRQVLTYGMSKGEAYFSIRDEQAAYAMGDRIRKDLWARLPQRVSTSA